MQFQNGNPSLEGKLEVLLAAFRFARFQARTQEYQQQGDASFSAIVLFFTALSLTRGEERRGEEGLSWTGGWGRDGIWWRELHVKAWGKLSLSQPLSLSLAHTHTHTHTHCVWVCVARRQPVSGEASVEAGYVGGMCVITELHKLKTNDNVD